MEIHIVGGCYPEICHWPRIDEIHGSGGRAAEVIAQLSQEAGTHLHSVLESRLLSKLQQKFSLLECEFHIESSSCTPVFEYEHPLSRPNIYPDVYQIDKDLKIEIRVKADNVIVFGMLEASSDVSADRLVYDPQNSISPDLFSETKNKAKELSIILNQAEARKLFDKVNGESASNEMSIETIAESLLCSESAAVIVVKCGQRGAYIRDSSNNSDWISAYKTDVIFPIGSGDCFVAAYSYYWMEKRLSPCDAARYASVITAFYCENRIFPDQNNVDQLFQQYSALKCHDNSKKKVYLAGPFFNLQEMWLINQARNALCNTGIDVFSPYHDVGPGSAEEVVHHDIDAIEKSDALYALFDGNDPGTLFEIGYAIKCGIPVIIYSENASDEHLKMYEGTGCLVCRDFSSSIYQLSWHLN